MSKLMIDFCSKCTHRRTAHHETSCMQCYNFSKNHSFDPKMAIKFTPKGRRQVLCSLCGKHVTTRSGTKGPTLANHRNKDKSPCQSSAGLERDYAAT